MGGVPDLEVLGSVAGTNEDPRGLRGAEAEGGEAGKPGRVCFLGAPWGPVAACAGQAGRSVGPGSQLGGRACCGWLWTDHTISCDRGLLGGQCLEQLVGTDAGR